MLWMQDAIPNCLVHNNKAFFRQTTIGRRPFQVIDTYYARLIMYHNKNRGEKKEYMLLFTVSLT